MEELGVIDLYENTNKEKAKNFIDDAESTLKVQVNRKCSVNDTEWMDLIEEIIPHLDSIFRKPNRFIENEEEIVKIEQAKKVTVETIKHLSKNTNFIQTVDKKTGDVIPSKLLNVRKEESYNTYENRLIYTLMQNMKFFISKKKEKLVQSIDMNNNDNGDKDNKKLEYNSKSKLNDEKVDINVLISSELDSQGKDAKSKKDETLKRIEEIERKITDVESTDVYRIIDKLNVSLVKEPIRKTNVVLKNVHFQYAMKLWEYLKEHLDQNAIGTIDENKEYMDEGILRKMMDEAFLLQYLIMRTLNEDETEKQDTKQEIKTIVLEQMIDKMLDLDENITEEQLKQMVAEKYEVIKYKKMAVLQDIQKIFKKHIDYYEERVETRE